MVVVASFVAEAVLVIFSASEPTLFSENFVVMQSIYLLVNGALSVAVLWFSSHLVNRAREDHSSHKKVSVM